MSDVGPKRFLAALRRLLAERCVFGTERPGIGTVKDPRTGRWLDETRYLIEDFDWLSAAEKKMIFEDNARKLFKI